MSKILKSFFIVVTFILGLSMGMYYGISANKTENLEVERPIDSIQDVIIKNVQSENELQEKIKKKGKSYG